MDVPSALRAFLEVQTCRAQLYTRFHTGFKLFLKTKHELQYKSLMTELTASFSECSRKVISIEAALRDLGRPDLATVLRAVQDSERDKLRLTLALQALKQAAVFRSFSWQQQQGKHGEQDLDDDEALALLDPQLAAAAHHRHHTHAVEPPNSPPAVTPAGCGGGGGGVLQEAEPDRVVSGPCALPAGGQEASLAVEPATEPSSEPDARGPDNGADHGGSHGGGHGASCGCGAGAAGGPPEPTRREFEAAVKEAMQAMDACIRTINEAIGDLRIELEDG